MLSLIQSLPLSDVFRHTLCLLLKSYTWVEQLKISPTSTQKPYLAAKKLGKHLRVSLNRKLSLYVFTDPVYDAQHFKVC